MIKWKIQAQYQDELLSFLNSDQYVLVADPHDIYDNSGDTFIFKGSIEFVRMVQNINNPKNICLATWKNYECSSFYPQFENFLFNKDYTICTSSYFEAHKWDLFAKHGREATVWIRPNSGAKPFTADLYELENCINQYNNVFINTVLVSSPKQSIGEWRFVCTRQKEILAASLYKYQDCVISVPSAPSKAYDVCEQVLNVGYFPDDVFIVDIIQGTNEKFYLLEFNAFSTSSLYKCYPKPIIEKINQLYANV